MEELRWGNAGARSSFVTHRSHPWRDHARRHHHSRRRRRGGRSIRAAVRCRCHSRRRQHALRVKMRQEKGCNRERDHPQYRKVSNRNDEAMETKTYRWQRHARRGRRGGCHAGRRSYHESSMFLEKGCQFRGHELWSRRKTRIYARDEGAARAFTPLPHHLWCNETVAAADDIRNDARGRFFGGIHRIRSPIPKVHSPGGSCGLYCG